jgi:uncharacterized protein YndB with AHSA1/START domain
MAASKAQDTVEDTADRQMVITRTVDAPRALVWQAWTQPQHIAAWWGPDGFRTTIHAMNVAVDGVWRFIMHGPDGTDYPNRIVYREIVEPERLVYDHDDDSPNPKIAFRSTVTFEDVGGKTRVTMRAVFPTKEAREAALKFGAEDGGKQTLARLDGHVQGMK